MFKKNQILSYLKYSVAAAIVYLICVVIFLSKDTYTQTYILYIGNMIYAFVIVVFIVNFNKRTASNESTYNKIAAGFTTAVIGVVISCLAILIILAIMKPEGYRDVLNTASELAQPAPGLDGEGHALMFILFMDAVIGNLGASAFVCFMVPNMIRKYQEDEIGAISPEYK